MTFANICGLLYVGLVLTACRIVLLVALWVLQAVLL